MISRYFIVLFLAVFSCGLIAEGKDLDVLILSPESDVVGSRVRTGFDASKMSLYLDEMLKATPSFTGSSCTFHTEVDVDSLLEIHYDTRYSATTAAEIKKDYDVVVMVPYYLYPRWAPELTFEAVMQLSSEILAAGARPILLMSVGDGNGDAGVVGAHSYRIVNGCGIEVNPAGYALLDTGLFVRSLGEQQAYLVAASLYAQITGLSAADLDYAPVAESVVLATAADANLVIQAGRTQYSGSQESRGMVRYRNVDLSAAPFNDTVRYAYVGTSTEAGISSYLQPIIAANGWTAAPKYISSDGGGTKYWTATDLDLAKSYFEDYPDQVLFTYARGTTSSSRLMVAEDQDNLMAMAFDRHRDNIGSGAGSSLEMLKDIEIGSWYDYYYQRSYQWNAVPFHVAATRLYHSDNSLIVSSDGVHVTTPFYNLIASMMLTSALGQDIQPSTAIQNNSQSLAAFNLGKTVVKQLAHLSETSIDIPDSKLAVITDRLPVSVTTVAYSQTLALSGGTAPYVWEEISSAGLPAGLSVSSAGVLSGTPTDDVGTHVLVFKVTDANGAIRKRALKLLVQDAANPSYSDWADFMFDNSGLSDAEQLQNADAEKDGFTNFFEYALGGNPLGNDGSVLFEWIFGDDLELRFMRAQGHLNYQLESSVDVTDWSDPDVLWDSSVDHHSLVSVGKEQTVKQDFTGDTQRFYRLQVRDL